jgi:hypothetical protein
MKAKMTAMKQAGAPRPGEPHPPPKWQPDTVTLNREEKLLSALVAQFRGGVADGKAIQSQLVGQLGHYTDKLDQITARLSFLEQNRRLRTGSSRSLSTGRVSQQGKSPASTVAQAQPACLGAIVWTCMMLQRFFRFAVGFGFG